MKILITDIGGLCFNVFIAHSVQPGLYFLTWNFDENKIHSDYKKQQSEGKWAIHSNMKYR